MALIKEPIIPWGEGRVKGGKCNNPDCLTCNRPKPDPIRQPEDWSFDYLRGLLNRFIRDGKQEEVKDFWDVMSAIRGPDGPSDLQKREARKFLTVQVIRGVAFGGAVGGNAKYRVDSKVVCLPSKEDGMVWDHFDEHVAKAAGALGLGIEPIVDEDMRARIQKQREAVKVAKAARLAAKEKEKDDNPF